MYLLIGVDMKTTELMIALLASALLFISVAAGQGSYVYGNAYSNAYAGGMYSNFGYYNATASASANVYGSMPPGMPYCPGGYCDQTSISASASASASAGASSQYGYGYNYSNNLCGCNPWDVWCTCYPYYSSSYYFTPSYYYYYTPSYYTPSYYYYYLPAYYYTPTPVYYTTRYYYYYTPSYYYYYTPIIWYSYYPTGPITTTFSYQQSTTIGPGIMMGY